jgi:hypothetical protein
MFGFLRPKLAPDGPVEIRREVEIAAPAEDAYALVDWADPRNGQRALGGEITPLAGVPGRFRCVLAALPGHPFEIAVTEAVPPGAYAFTCEAVPRVGRLVRSHERYTFEPMTRSSCRLTLVMTATLAGPLRMKDHEHEVGTITRACRSALAKLKIHAEEGVEAARAVQDRILD